MNRKTKIAALALSVVLALQLVACTNTNDAANNSSSTASVTNEPVQEKWDGSLPITDEPITLTIFAPLSAKAADSVTSYEELIAFQEVEKLTNVNLEWEHPPVGKEKDQFNLMVASRSVPDLIYYKWLTYAGGPAKAIEDKIILPLNDLYENNSVHLKKIFEEYPMVYKCSITDNGEFYSVQNIVNTKLNEFDIWSESSSGPQYRKDWADKVGYTKTPETMDDWYELLTLFKKNDCNGNGDPNDEIPLVDVSSRNLKYYYSAFGILKDFYMEEDKISHGYLNPDFKVFIETMKKWYAEGLLDPDYISTDNSSFKAKITGDIAGAYLGSMDGNFGQFTKLMENHPTCKIVGAPWPKGTTTDSYTIQGGLKQPTGTSSMAITTKNKNPELSFRFLDACFSEQLVDALNFGAEGQTYVKENNVIKLTDKLIQESVKKPIDSVISSYAVAGTDDTFSTIRLVKEVNGVRRSEAQNEIAKIWSTGKDVDKLILPPLTPSVDESAEMADIMNQVNTYADEMINKFIMGQTDMSQFDEFIQNLKKMGIEKAVEIQNAALVRFNQR